VFAFRNFSSQYKNQLRIPSFHHWIIHQSLSPSVLMRHETIIKAVSKLTFSLDTIVMAVFANVVMTVCSCCLWDRVFRFLSYLFSGCGHRKTLNFYQLHFMTRRKTFIDKTNFMKCVSLSINIKFVCFIAAAFLSTAASVSGLNEW
jgi:hypothetical protein